MKYQEDFLRNKNWTCRFRKKSGSWTVRRKIDSRKEKM